MGPAEEGRLHVWVPVPRRPRPPVTCRGEDRQTNWRLRKWERDRRMKNKWMKKGPPPADIPGYFRSLGRCSGWRGAANPSLQTSSPASSSSPRQWLLLLSTPPSSDLLLPSSPELEISLKQQDFGLFWQIRYKKKSHPIIRLSCAFPLYVIFLCWL